MECKLDPELVNRRHPRPARATGSTRQARGEKQTQDRVEEPGREGSLGGQVVQDALRPKCRKKYPTAGLLDKPQRQHWDIAMIKTPPERLASGLAAMVELGLNEGIMVGGPEAHPTAECLDQPILGRPKTSA